MNTVKVVAAIILKDERIFVTQRGYGEFKDLWEFPGGKIEEGEYPEAALVREIKEELDVDIVISRSLTTVEYDYPNFHLSMECFEAELIAGQEIVLKEHEAAKWLHVDNLDLVNWLPADYEVVKKLKEENTE